ncbi:MAG: hypothetical protein PHV97_06560, partial [Candidatus Omnitrophica bacterium]|nr:hypothetical protein [Candidatus Omnitrophota bacterium]
GVDSAKLDAIVASIQKAVDETQDPRAKQERINALVGNLAMTASALTYTDAQGRSYINQQVVANAVLAAMATAVSAEILVSLGFTEAFANNITGAYKAMTSEAQTLFRESLAVRTVDASENAVAFLALGAQMQSTPGDFSKVEIIAVKLGVRTRAIRDFMKAKNEQTVKSVAALLIAKAGSFDLESFGKFSGLLLTGAGIQTMTEIELDAFLKPYGIQGFGASPVFRQELGAALVEVASRDGVTPQEIRQVVYRAALASVHSAADFSRFARVIFGAKADTLANIAGKLDSAQYGLFIDTLLAEVNTTSIDVASGKFLDTAANFSATIALASLNISALAAGAGAMLGLNATDIRVLKQIKDGVSQDKIGLYDVASQKEAEKVAVAQKKLERIQERQKAVSDLTTATKAVTVIQERLEALRESDPATVLDYATRVKTGEAELLAAQKILTDSTALARAVQSAEAELKAAQAEFAKAPKNPTVKAVLQKYSLAFSTVAMMRGKASLYRLNFHGQSVESYFANAPPSSMALAEASLARELLAVSGNISQDVFYQILAPVLAEMESKLVDYQDYIGTITNASKRDEAILSREMVSSALRSLANLGELKAGVGFGRGERQLARRQAEQQIQKRKAISQDKAAQDALRVISNYKNTRSKLASMVEAGKKSAEANRQSTTEGRKSFFSRMVQSVQKAAYTMIVAIQNQNVQSVISRLSSSESMNQFLQMLSEYAEDGQNVWDNMVLEAKLTREQNTALSKWRSVEEWRQQKTENTDEYQSNKDRIDRAVGFQGRDENGDIDTVLRNALYSLASTDYAQKAFAQHDVLAQQRQKNALMAVFAADIKTVKGYREGFIKELEAKLKERGLTLQDVNSKDRKNEGYKIAKAFFSQKSQELAERTEISGLKSTRLEAMGLYAFAIGLTKGWALYDEQIMAGLVMNYGWNIAELATGEGKTVVGTLSALVNSLEKKGSFIVTTKDKSAVDAFLDIAYGVGDLTGRTVGLVQDKDYSVNYDAKTGKNTVSLKETRMAQDAKRAEYAKDITYVSINNWAFDTGNDVLEVKVGEDSKKIIAR